MSPCRLWPSAKSWPTTSARRSKASRSMSQNCSAPQVLTSRVNGSTTRRSRPTPRAATAFSPSVVSDCGQCAGSSTQRGCGSKVSSALCAPARVGLRADLLEQRQRGRGARRRSCRW